MKKRQLSDREKSQLISDAERYWGLPPGAGSPANYQRSYPSAMIPRREAGGRGGDFGGGAQENMEDVVERCWTFYRCLVIIADAHSSLVGKLGRGRDDAFEEVLSGQAHDLLEFINPEWDPSMLWGMTSMTLDTSKKGCFWILDGLDGGGKPTEIWWAHPDSVKPVRGNPQKDEPDKWYISHYEVQVPGQSGKPTKFDRERIVWIRTPSPFNEFNTLSSAASAMDSAGLALASMHANRMIFDTGLTGAAIIGPEDTSVTWSDEDVDEMQGMVSTTVQGRKGWRRVLVTNRSDFTIKDLQGMSPRELQFAQMLSLTKEQICIAMGVPLPLLSPTDSTFSNAHAARRTFLENTVGPRDKRIARAIESQLLAPYFSGEADSFWFDYDAFPEMQADTAAKWGLDKDQLGAMLMLVEKLRGGQLTRDGALQAAYYYIGAPEDIAEAMFEETPVVEGGVGPVQIDLPSLPELISLLSGVMAGTVPRASAVAILATRMGDQVAAEYIVGEVGAYGRQTQLPTLEFARSLVQDVMGARMPRGSAMALLAEALGDGTKAGLVLSDAQPTPALALSDGLTGDAAPDAGTEAADPDIFPRGKIVVYSEGVGYVVGDDGSWDERAQRTPEEYSIEFPVTASVPRVGRLFSRAEMESAKALDAEWKSREDDPLVYGSRAHRAAWEVEESKFEKRRKTIEVAAAKILAMHALDASRGIGKLSADKLASLVEAWADADDSGERGAKEDALAKRKAALAQTVVGKAARNRWIEKGTGMIEPELRALASQVADETLGALGSDLAIDLSAGSEIGVMLRRQAQTISESTANTSWERIANMLAREVQSGGTLEDMKAGIAAIEESWAGSRAELIARTSTHSAAHEVARETVRATGLAKSRTWYSSLDDRVRESHRDAHGQTVGVNEQYEVGDGKCDGPGSCDDVGEVANCRCYERWNLEPEDA